MPTTYAIPDGRTVMAATTYTGNGSTQTVSNAVNGVSFQPDFVWIKSRSNAQNHIEFDSVRGDSQVLYPNLASAEDTLTGQQSFASTGFSLGGGYANTNASAYTYVGWQWKAGGTAVSNTAGTITSSVSANTTAGFSVVTFTKTATTSQTIGHGLGVAPQLIIVKTRQASGFTDWAVWHTSIGIGNYIVLNSTAAVASSSTIWNNTAPTSTVFSMGTAWTATQNMVAYCFAPIAGYSAFGSYTGNGSADGPFIYTGFKPRYLLIKRTDAANNWVIQDTSRSPYNVSQNNLYADTSGAEASYAAELTDILSNGFKQRGTGVSMNASGGTYIYAAFAENPFKYANAR
jgi:hypothetical protein